MNPSHDFNRAKKLTCTLFSLQLVKHVIHGSQFELHCVCVCDLWLFKACDAAVCGMTHVHPPVCCKISEGQADVRAPHICGGAHHWDSV